MKLRCKANQAECFRAGINQEKSIVVLSVDPAKLPKPDRELIARHLDGIDVMVDKNEERRGVVTIFPVTLDGLVATLKKIESE